MAEDRRRILYGEPPARPPTYSVHRYIQYLRDFVSGTGTNSRTPVPGKAADRKRNTPPDVLNPLSYFLRKLKLDLKTSYSNFVSDFIAAPYNGLRLLLTLLKNVQGHSGKGMMAAPRTGGSSNSSSLHIEGYKQTMVDELDCLLCIKYTLRVEKAMDEVTENNTGLHTIVSCCLSHFYKSRIAALEILSLLVTGPTAVDRILEAFTAIRVQYSESTRFKMLINMLYTRGMDNLIFQISTLRLLNALCNMCKSPNMRVFLQYEMEEAGLDLGHLQQATPGHGLEYDDLDKQIHEWKTRYIDVSTLLKKIKMDMRRDFNSHAVSDYTFDQRYGNPLPIAASRHSWDHPGTPLSSSSTIDDPRVVGVQDTDRRTGGWYQQMETTPMYPPSDHVIFYTGRDSYVTSRVDHTVHQILSRTSQDVLTLYDNNNSSNEKQLQQQHQPQQLPYQHQQQQQLPYQHQHQHQHQQQHQQLPYQHRHEQHNHQRHSSYQQQYQLHHNHQQPQQQQKRHEHNQQQTPPPQQQRSLQQLHSPYQRASPRQQTTQQPQPTPIVQTGKSQSLHDLTGLRREHTNNNNGLVYDVLSVSATNISTPNISNDSSHRRDKTHGATVDSNSNNDNEADFDAFFSYDDNWVFRKPSADKNHNGPTLGRTDIDKDRSPIPDGKITNFNQAHSHQQTAPVGGSSISTRKFKTGDIFYTGSNSDDEVAVAVSEHPKNDSSSVQSGDRNKKRSALGNGPKQSSRATEYDVGKLQTEKAGPSLPQPANNTASSCSKMQAQEYKPKNPNSSKSPGKSEQMQNAKAKVITGLLRAAKQQASGKDTDRKSGGKGVRGVANGMTANLNEAPPTSSHCDDVIVKDIPPECDQDVKEALMELDRTLEIHEDRGGGNVKGDSNSNSNGKDLNGPKRAPVAATRTFMAYI